MSTILKCLAAVAVLLWLTFLTCRIVQTRYAVEQACAYSKFADDRDPLPPQLPLPLSDACAHSGSIESIIFSSNPRHISAHELLGAWLMQK